MSTKITLPSLASLRAAGIEVIGKPVATERRSVGGRHMQGSQSTMPVFLSNEEAAVTRRACVRYAAFLRAELERIPEQHPLRRRYQRQLEALEQDLGPSDASYDGARGRGRKAGGNGNS